MRWKTAWLARLIAACAAGLAAQPQAQPAPLVVGAVVSRSGLYADLAAGYARGLELWQDEVNGAGGLLGRRVELRLLDDASEAGATGRLYEQLIGEGAELLVGPYGTAATIGAAAVAERRRRVMINGSAAARAVHKDAHRYLFQATPPYAAYGSAIAGLVHQAGLRSVLLLARDEPVAREMANGARDAALKLGMTVPGIEVHGAELSDFAPQVAKARAAQAEAWVAFANAREAAEMVKTFRRLGYAPRLFFASGAAEAQFMRLVGQDAEFALGTSAYDPAFATTGNAGFARAYAGKWSAPPGLAAAQGYVAGQVLGEALRSAGTVDQEALRKALLGLRAGTVLGEFRADARTGEQQGMLPPVLQIRGGKKVQVWPAGATAVVPYPAWSERKILR